MIKKINTRICITIPKTLLKDLKILKEKEETTYSKIITEGLQWYLINTNYRDLKFKPKRKKITIPKNWYKDVYGD